MDLRQQIRDEITRELIGPGDLVSLPDRLTELVMCAARRIVAEDPVAVARSINITAQLRAELAGSYAAVLQTPARGEA